MNATAESPKTEKVYKSTADCQAWNAAHAAEIECGISFPQEPDSRMLAEEAKRREYEAKQFKATQDRLEILKQLDPKTNGKTCLGVQVEIDEIRSGGGKWYSGSVSGYRLYIGSRWGDAKGKWVAIGDGATLGISAKQLEKAKAALATVKAEIDARNAKYAASQNEAARTEQFIKDNPEFAKLSGHCYHCSGESYKSPMGTRYTTAFLVTVEGLIKIGYETYTKEQWLAVFRLRDEQAAVMKALKESFKNNLPQVP